MGAQVKIIDVNGEVLIGKEFVSTVQFLELPLRQEKMKKYFIIISILLFSTCALATSVDISTYFQKQSGCFILFDVNENKLIKKYTPARCDKRISSGTVKIKDLFRDGIKIKHRNPGLNIQRYGFHEKSHPN